MSNVARFVRKRQRPVEFVAYPHTKFAFDAIVRRWEANGCKPFRVRAEELAPKVHPEDWKQENTLFSSARNYAVYRTRVELRNLELCYKLISARAAGRHGKEITLTTNCRVVELDPRIAPSPAPAPGETGCNLATAHERALCRSADRLHLARNPLQALQAWPRAGGIGLPAVPVPSGCFLPASGSPGALPNL